MVGAKTKSQIKDCGMSNSIQFNSIQFNSALFHKFLSFTTFINNL